MTSGVWPLLGEQHELGAPNETEEEISHLRNTYRRMLNELKPPTLNQTGGGDAEGKAAV